MLQKSLRTCEKHSRRNSYTFAPEKCKVIARAFQVGAEDTKHVTLVNSELEYVDTFDYLGVPITAKGIDFKVMCQSRVDAAIKMSAYFKRVGCSGMGYPPTIVRKILHTFVRPLMEYGLGLQQLQKRERNKLDKSWFQIWRNNQSLPRSTSSLAILKTFRSPAMSFRNAKLNAGYLARLRTMKTDSLAKRIYDQVSTPTRRCSRHNVVKKSKNNHIWSQAQEWLVKKHSYKKIKASRLWKSLDLEHLQTIDNDDSSMPRQIRRKTARDITVPGMMMDYFLIQQANTEEAKKTRRELLLWRLGILPGEAKICKGCSEEEVTTREHVARCAMSGTKSNIGLGNQETNPLDDILNDNDTITAGEQMSKINEIIEYIVQRCLGRSTSCR